MKELSPLEQLDLILKEVADHSNPDITLHQIFHGYNNAYLKDWNKIKLILTMLVEDKLIERLKIHTTHINNEGKEHAQLYHSYCITFTGQVFLENGGYMGRNSRDNDRNDQIHQLEKSQISISRLTVVIAVGTSLAGIYYLIEISKWIYSAFHH